VRFLEPPHQVATRVGGVPELITHGEDGFLEPVRDVAAQAARVAALLTGRGHASSTSVGTVRTIRAKSSLGFNVLLRIF